MGTGHRTASQTGVVYFHTILTLVQTMLEASPFGSNNVGGIALCPQVMVATSYCFVKMINCLIPDHLKSERMQDGKDCIAPAEYQPASNYDCDPVFPVPVWLSAVISGSAVLAGRSVPVLSGGSVPVLSGRSVPGMSVCSRCLALPQDQRSRAAH